MVLMDFLILATRVKKRLIKFKINFNGSGISFCVGAYRIFYLRFMEDGLGANLFSYFDAVLSC